MNFQEGDPVVHWTYGFGQVVRLEERELAGTRTLYYAVQVRDLTVWVPDDGKLESRLRPPTPETEFKKIINILSGPGKPLPEDRHERKTRLQEMQKNGGTEALCHIIRDLHTYQKVKSLNDNDQVVLKQSQTALLGEWGFVFSISAAQAEIELHRVLAPKTHEIKE